VWIVRMRKLPCRSTLSEEALYTLKLPWEASLGV